MIKFVINFKTKLEIKIQFYNIYINVFYISFFDFNSKQYTDFKILKL